MTNIKLTTTSSKDLVDNYMQTKRKNGIMTTLVLAFQTLGVIYGDIGTSPLYVFTGIFPNEPPEDELDIVGACSLIIWSLTIVPMIKYIFIVLRADDNGQGGTFALYSLLNRYSGLSVRGEQKSDDLTVVNYDSTHSIKETQNFITRHKFVQNFLLTVVLLGASLIMSDGLLTPAISVISAVEGITIPFPTLPTSVVPVISSVIIILLFAVQRFGTNKVGGLFAPIVALWFLTIACIGIWNIMYYPQIFKAFNPYYVFNYFIRNKGVGFESLGGVLLAITGVEALYADLGHFNRVSIQLSFPVVVYPALVLAYLGQGARLVIDHSIISNTFWNTTPSGFIYYFTFVIATLATIIASQAMISATFTLVSQAMQLDAFPRVKVIHTSKDVEGQIYIPEINYILMIVIVIIIFAFQKSANLTIAYGVAVSSVMFFTTILLSMVLHVVWRLPIIFSVAFFLIFGIVDVSFLSSTLLKIQNGGWFTLLVGLILVTIMSIWRWGTTLKFQHELNSKATFESIFVTDDKSHDPKPDEDNDLNSNDKSNELIISHLSSSKESIQTLKLTNTGFKVNRLPGIGIFYNEAGIGVPLTFRHFIHHFPAVPQVLIFMDVRPLAIPYVGEDDRLAVKIVSNYVGWYHVTARYGYMENVSHGQDFVTKIIEAICKIDPVHKSLSDTSNPVTYIISQQSIHPKSNASLLKKILIHCFVLLDNNSRQLYGNWNIPIDDVIDVGMKLAL